MRHPHHSSPPVLAGAVSPIKTVPADIPRPDYAESGVPQVTAPDDLKKDIATIERMRLAGSAARRVLRKVANEISPGVTTDYLDQVCHQACIEEGGYPSPLNYNGYPKSLCTSINEIICHGIPGKYGEGGSAASQYDFSEAVGAARSRGLHGTPECKSAACPSFGKVLA